MNIMMMMRKAAHLPLQEAQHQAHQQRQGRREEDAPQPEEIMMNMKMMLTDKIIECKF
jgi:hypothetical protein